MPFSRVLANNRHCARSASGSGVSPDDFIARKKRMNSGLRSSGVERPALTEAKVFFVAVHPARRTAVANTGEKLMAFAARLESTAGMEVIRR